jgi:SNF2 family DNA or RNA helicase
MPAALVKNGDTLELDLSNCRGSEFQDALTKIKDVPGRRFDGDRKLWLLQAEPSTAERVLSTVQPTADPSLLEWVRAARMQESQELSSPLPDDADLLLPWARERLPWQPAKVNDEPFNGLFDYQRAAVDVMATNARALLADDMGLGKTIQTIAAVEEAKLRDPDLKDGPKLVIAPNSVKGAWARELDRWLESPAYQIIDATSLKARHNQLERAIKDNAWCIVNWEQIRIKQETVKLRNGGTKKVKVMREELFEVTPWMAAIADEIHRAKNRKSQTAQGLWRIQAPIMYGLSGTPLMNTPDELWSPLRWLWPNDYHERGSAHNPGARAYWSFYEQYVDYYEAFFSGHASKVITGVKNPDALRFELKGRLIRRTSEGRTPGRKRVYFDVTLNPKQRKLYDEAVTQLWIEVEQQAAEGDQSAIKFAEGALNGVDLVKLPNGAARTVRLRQIIETPFTLGGDDDSAVLDDCVDRIMDSRPKQWVVFCEFKPTCVALVARLQKAGLNAALYNGDVAPAVRTQLEDEFQRAELDVIVGTIAAMKEGITLTAANMQYWVSRDWVPDNNEQGEARCDRTGQQQRVTILIPQAENTVAVSKIEPTNRLKERIVRTVLPKAPIQEERE